MWISFGPKPAKEPRVVRAARVVGLVRGAPYAARAGASRSVHCHRARFLAHVRLRDQAQGSAAIDSRTASAAIRSRRDPTRHPDVERYVAGGPEHVSAWAMELLEAASFATG
jgi:hypothetical protein